MSNASFATAIDTDVVTRDEGARDAHAVATLTERTGRRNAMESRTRFNDVLERLWKRVCRAS